MASDSSPILRHKIDAGTYTDHGNILRDSVRNKQLSPEDRVTSIRFDLMHTLTLEERQEVMRSAADVLEAHWAEILAQLILEAGERLPGFSHVFWRGISQG